MLVLHPHWGLKKFSGLLCSLSEINYGLVRECEALSNNLDTLLSEVVENCTIGLQNGWFKRQ